MRVLVVNCGSSSLKAAIIDGSKRLASGQVERIGSDAATLKCGDASDAVEAKDHAAALAALLPKLVGDAGEGAIAGVGHRVVHGGSEFGQPVRIDDKVVSAIDRLSELAPLHNPANLSGIRAARELLPDATHVAVFDTAFHATLPRRARSYAIDQDVADEHKIRRYGFHGPSHRYVSELAARHLQADPRDLRLISCHLGNGCSVTAIEYGRSVETSMGMTPLEGLVMGTRSGDIDAGALLALSRSGMDADQIDTLLNRKSGLLGLSGVSNDLREIEARAAEGDERAMLAMQVFSHRVRKYIGAYAATMGGVDAILFTAGIGQNSASMRHRIAQRLDFLGAALDEDRNRSAKVDPDTPVRVISSETSRCHLLVVATDEQQAIADQTRELLQEMDRVKAGAPTIPVAVSARHVHLSEETLAQLFGEGYKLTEYKPLSQPGQFAAKETVSIVGPKSTIERVRILGPTRSKNQIEISRTDEFALGIDAPVRASGDVANSPGIRVVGPAGTVDLKQGVICAWRHIHMHPDDAERFGVEDKDVVEVAVEGPGRALIFGDVLVRVSPKYKLEMHIDTDEANAAELSSRSDGALIETDGKAHLNRKSTRSPKR